MKQALQVTIVLSLAVLLAVSYGLAFRLSAFFLVDAFGKILPREDAAMLRELVRWVVYFGASLGVSVWLWLAYRRCKRTLWKSE